MIHDFPLFPTSGSIRWIMLREQAVTRSRVIGIPGWNGQKEGIREKGKGKGQVQLRLCLLIEISALVHPDSQKRTLYVR